MLNIVIPMAGRGSRFAEAGYDLPKPMIDICGKPMIEVVVNNIKPSCEHRFIFICRNEHLRKYQLNTLLSKIAPGCEIVVVEEVTEGAACTVLLAEQYINDENPLMIANSDQFVDIDINCYLDELKGWDGLIMTMPAKSEKWSYIKYNSDGMVTLVREKEIISDQATVGIYNYQRGADFVKYAKSMIKKNIKVNGEFYVAPVYNEMICDGAKIVYYDIKDKMNGLGTPEDLILFLDKRR